MDLAGSLAGGDLEDGSMQQCHRTHYLNHRLRLPEPLHNGSSDLGSIKVISRGERAHDLDQLWPTMRAIDESSGRLGLDGQTFGSVDVLRSIHARLWCSMSVRRAEVGLPP